VKTVMRMGFIMLCVGMARADVTSSAASGCIVERVRGWSPADKAGLDTGDVITEANGRPVNNSEELIAIVQTAPDALPLVIRRGETTQTVTAYLPQITPKRYLRFPTGGR
jgi:S1-C subfamily serine protease